MTKFLTILLFAILLLGANQPVFGVEKLRLAFKSKVEKGPAPLHLRDVLDASQSSPELEAQYGEVVLPETGGSGHLQPAHVLIALGRVGMDLDKLDLLTIGEIEVVPAVASVATPLKTAVVAKHPVGKGETVSAIDFEEKEIQGDVQEGAVLKLSELGNSRWQMNDTLLAGATLTRDQVNFSNALKKGAVVTLLSGSERFQIRTVGRVLEVLDNGASVLVENLDSKKELLGKPLNASEVRIGY